MNYFILSFTHKNTDIATREKLAFQNELAKEYFIKETIKSGEIYEIVLLSTCNRVEIICFVRDFGSASKILLNQLSIHSRVDVAHLEEIGDKFEGQSAIHHLFMVASSLDSLVVGETQIAGQLKDAFKFSMNKSYCLNNIGRVIHFSFKCAAAVRNATTIGANSVSVASAAVAKARSICAGSFDKRALVVGSGEMSELTIKHLLKHDFDVILISRNLKKAELLASTLEKSIKVEKYSNLEDLLNQIPFVFSATSAPYPIVTKSMAHKCNFERYWFDIAVPRDIEDFKFDGINIFAVDDLKDIVEEHIVLRSEQAKEAYKIVSKMTMEFYTWLSQLEVEPLIKQLHQRANAILDKKIQNALKKRFIKIEDTQNIEKLAKSVVAELLHTPSFQLRTIAKTNSSDVAVETVAKLFALQARCDKYFEEEI